MDFRLTREQQEWVERSEALATEFATRARQYDESSTIPLENFKRYRDEGFLKLTTPEEYGGYGMWSGRNYLPLYLILEALAAGDTASSWLLFIHNNGAGIIASNGQEELKRRVLTDVVENGKLCCSIGSEQDPASIGTGKETVIGSGRLRPVEGGFLLSALKHYASLAPAADYYVVHTIAPGIHHESGARTLGEGYVQVMIEKSTPGVELIDNWDIMGMRATQSLAVRFDDVFVPYENVLGEPGDWIQRDPRTFTLGHCAIQLGTARGAYNYLREYLKQSPDKDDVVISQFAEMQVMIETTHLAMLHAAWLWEENEFEQAELASLRALTAAQRTGIFVTTKGFEICGPRGAFKQYPLERMYRDLRTITLHKREIRWMRMMTEAELHGEFHAKRRYGEKLDRHTWRDLGVPLDLGKRP
jgi:alkylation response protein AidB-like acyl-CoA dehydrogenase